MKSIDSISCTQVSHKLAVNITYLHYLSNLESGPIWVHSARDGTKYLPIYLLNLFYFFTYCFFYYVPTLLCL